jgi:hypothetical protein
MRKFLLASVATLGTAGLMSAAYAQAPVAVGPAPTQGQAAWTPAASPPAGANNNNNYQAPALPGPVANPTPGTIVVHVNGKVEVSGWAAWSSADSRLVAVPGAPAGTPASSVKLQPVAIGAFAREYFGADGMATNGLRYGAAIELRENFTGQPNGASASTYSSLETVFVRRAFTYIAGEQWGILRAGQGDGLISIFDNGVTTFQFSPTGVLNGGDLEAATVGNSQVPFFFLGQAGAEYANTKLVYLSPQIAGFDFGLQYAPNTANGFGTGGGTAGGVSGGITGGAIGTGLSCSVANTGCPNLASGPGALDGSRIMNQTAVGVRYQGKFGGVGLLAYGVYQRAGHANYTGLSPATATTPAGVAAANAFLGNTAGSRYTGQYDDLSFGSGGIALTFAGFTVGGNVIGGRLNAQLNPSPVHGASEIAFLIGAKYVTGPLTVGIVAERGDYQGNVNMSGLTQRRGRAIDFGVSYAVAPGLTTYAEYMYQDIYQGGVNMVTGAFGTAAGSNLNNTIRSQGVLIGNVVNF